VELQTLEALELTKVLYTFVASPGPHVIMMNLDRFKLELVTSVPISKWNIRLSIHLLVFLYHKLSRSCQKVLLVIIPSHAAYTNITPVHPTFNHNFIMSAPNAGRQSPPPERQSGSQQQDTPGTGRTSVGSHPSPEHASHASEEFKQKHMPSNPEHPLEKIEADKFVKQKHH
jgi:hypothetical protein